MFEETSFGALILLTSKRSSFRLLHDSDMWFSMWGFYLGRPFRVNMEDVTVSKPSSDSLQASNHAWTPYVSSKSIQRAGTRRDYPDTLLGQRVLMAEIMAPLGYAL